MARARRPAFDPPDPFVYGRLERYLEDWTDAREQAGLPASVPWLEKRAELTPGTLADILRYGRAITEEETRRLVSIFGPRGAAGRFLYHLIRFECTRALDERLDALRAAVAQMEASAERRGDGPAFRARLHWYYASIQTLAAAMDFQRDPAWIAERLPWPVEEADVAVALQDLDALGGLREAPVPRRVQVGVESDLADVLAVADHLLRTRQMLNADPLAPYLVTAFAAVHEGALPLARRATLATAGALRASARSGPEPVAVEVLLRAATVTRPLPRRGMEESGPVEQEIGE